MKQKILDLPTRLTLLGVIILLAGFAGAMLIYKSAGNNSSGALGYRQEGGSVYPIMPDDSKKYLRDMELYGGKANVIVDQFRRWFIGLWEGKSLAYTVACITIFASIGIFYAANRLVTNLESDNPSENNQDITTRS